MPSFGLIVEGSGDVKVLSKLIPRVDTPGSPIHPLECGGKSKLMTFFPSFLERFKHIDNGGPVDKALVVRDADWKSVEEVQSQMRQKLGHRTYPFPVELCVICRCLDTWLLADHTAVTDVAVRRGGRAVGPVREELEEIDDAKRRLMRMLGEARLPYTPAVLEEIAENVNLSVLRNRSRSFVDFEEKVNRGL